MKNRKIMQIAHIVRNLDKTIEQYHACLGLGPWDIYTFEPPLLRDSIYRGKPSDHSFLVAVTWIGAMQIEVMQPLSGYSIYNEFLDKNGEGLHHIKEYSSDCEKTIEEYKAKGIDVIQSGKIDEDEFYYLDTESRFGIICEIGNAGKVRPPTRRYPE